MPPSPARSPFSETPDPATFFESAGHLEALERVRYAIEGVDAPLAAVAGPSGIGKSLVRLRFERGGSRGTTSLASVQATPGGARGVMADVLEASGQAPAGELPDYFALLAACRRTLAELAARGRRFVVLLDDAHVLTTDDWARLSPLVTGTEEGLLLVLFGLPAMWRPLSEHPLLDGRLLIRYEIPPLSHEETGAYLAHRLLAAGHPTGERFEPEAAEVIHHFSGGVPRVMNHLARFAIEYADMTSNDRVGVEIIRNVVLDYLAQRRV